MDDLTSNQQSFISRMTDGESYARHGFDILSKREDPEKYFDALLKTGLLDPSLNSGPVAATQPGSYYEPYWNALDYLLAVAKKAGAEKSAVLGNKVMNVVRAVSSWKDNAGEIRQNSTTYWRFAEILGYVPTACVTTDDIKLAALWMSSRFNSGMAGHALARAAIPHFLSSGDAENVEKACLLLSECSAFNWIESGRPNREVELVLENHWFEQLLQNCAKDFGIKAGERASGIFYQRLKELFSHSKRKSSSTLWRPAIEQHNQNLRWHEVENRLIDGLRDILNAWVETGDVAATKFVEDKLRDDTEIVRRIAVHVVDEHFSKLSAIFLASISSNTFNIGHIHEVYRLLTRHFDTLMPEQQQSIVTVLRSLPVSEKFENEPSRHKRVQRLWLSAIVGRGSKEADVWYADLQKDPDVGGLSEHPDFLSYHESWTGPGPSPMAEESIIAFAHEGTLVQQLNAFTETDSWRGPTLGGLCDMVEQAAADETALFLSVLKTFKTAKVAHQYSVLNGLKRSFDSSIDQEGKVDWASAWPVLLGFSFDVISAAAFWDDETPERGMELIPRRSWFLSLVSDLIQSGGRDDVRGYKPEEFPQVRALLRILLERSGALSALSDTTDAVNLSINSSKGRAVEALLNHALKECRLANQGGNGHEEAWTQLQPLFDAELAKCKSANFEFSALAGHYYSNIDYMSATWLADNIKAIFPTQYPTNMAAAVDGLAYASASAPIFKQLRDAGVIDWALKHELGENGRRRLVERIVLAYLWNIEPIGGAIMGAIISPARLQDVETAAQFFWGVQGENLPEDEIELILAFWSASLGMLDGAQLIAPNIRSSLSRLAVYIKVIGERERRLLLNVAPYVQADYNAVEFIEELDRLSAEYPGIIAEVLLTVLKSHIPAYDADDILFELVRRLEASGQRQIALEITAILQKGCYPKALALFQALNP